MTKIPWTLIEIIVLACLIVSFIANFPKKITIDKSFNETQREFKTYDEIQACKTLDNTTQRLHCLGFMEIN